MKNTDLLNNQIYAKDTLNKQLELKIPPFVLHCFFSVSSSCSYWPNANGSPQACAFSGSPNRDEINGEGSEIF